MGAVIEPALRRKFAADEPEERGLAGAVAPDEPDPRPARQRGGRVVDQQALAEPVGEGVDMEHGGLLARQRVRLQDRTGRLRLRLVEQGAFAVEEARGAGADQRRDDEQPKLRDALRV